MTKAISKAIIEGKKAFAWESEAARARRELLLAGISSGNGNAARQELAEMFEGKVREGIQYMANLHAMDIAVKDIAVGSRRVIEGGKASTAVDMLVELEDGVRIQYSNHSDRFELPSLEFRNAGMSIGQEFVHRAKGKESVDSDVQFLPSEWQEVAEQGFNDRRKATEREVFAA